MRPSTRVTQQLCSRLSSRSTQALRQQTPTKPFFLPTLVTQPPTLRAFTTTPTFLQKGGKKGPREASSPSTTTAEDPFDFSTLDSEIQKALDQLKDDLSQLRQGGRFNPSTLESLRVQLKTTTSSSSSSIKLGDLAQVIPKGRVVQVIVGEQDHLKAVSSAIQGSDLSLTPQVDPTGQNPLLLNIPIPPPTAESRKATVAAAVKAGDSARNAVRKARQTQQKRLRAMQLAKSARPDNIKKAGAQMEKVVEKGTGEVKRILDAAKKALDT